MTTLNNPTISVVVIIGAGGIGQAIGSEIAEKGMRLLYTDFSKEILSEAVRLAHQEGTLAESQLVDISSRDSMDDLAHVAQAIGKISAVILTAGLLPVFATAKAILEVKLVSTANVIVGFAAYAERGASMVCIASMGGHMAEISKDMEYHSATVAPRRLLDHSDRDPSALNSGKAYMIAKQTNHLRIQASAHLWASEGARLNSVSPSVIFTAAGNAEIEARPEVKRLIELSAMVN